MLTRQPAKASANSVQVKSGTMISSDGENTNTNGTSALAERQPEGGVAGPERVGAGHAGGRIGRERHRRRDVGQHAVIEDEEVRDDRLHAQKRRASGAAIVTMMM